LSSSHTSFTPTLFLPPQGGGNVRRLNPPFKEEVQDEVILLSRRRKCEKRRAYPHIGGNKRKSVLPLNGRKREKFILPSELKY